MSVSASEAGRGTGASESREEEHAYDAQYDVTRYYDALQDVMFPCEFMPLDKDDLEAMLAVCESTQAQAEGQTSSHNIKYSGAHAQRLQELMDRTDGCMIDLLAQGDEWGVMCRLDNLSGKDAVLWSEAMQDELFEHLQRVQKGSVGTAHTLPLDSNGELEAILRSTVAAARTRCAEEAFYWFARSQRVMRYLQRCVEVGVEETHLVVRPWRSLDIAMEFRGFVYQGVHTALCQSFTQCYFEQLQDKSTLDDVQQLIADCFHQHVAPHVRHVDNYVIDWVIHDGRAWVIELNPWQAGTSALLFDWTKDAAVLIDTTVQQPQLRVVTEMPTPIKAPVWRETLDEMYEQILEHNGKWNVGYEDGCVVL